MCEVSERQLRLFPHSKPLLTRFGSEFFSTAPKSPGVYVMTGSSGEILYVGQSKNVRARLGTYRNANPEHLPRRIVRLVHLVASITWEKCESASVARVRENELLRLHRPRFNRMNTYPAAYCFLGLRRGAERIELFWNRREDGVANYGAFKSGAVMAYCALIRLLWSATRAAGAEEDHPRPLLTGKAPSRFSVDAAAGGWHDVQLLARLLHEFLAGASNLLLRWLTAAIRTDRLSPFHRRLIDSDLALLCQFYESGPKRLHRLKREHGVGEQIVPKDELDDLIALSSPRRDDQQSLTIASSVHASNHEFEERNVCD